MFVLMNNEIKTALELWTADAGLGCECTLLRRSCDRRWWSMDFYKKHTRVRIIHIIYYRGPRVVCVKQPRSEGRVNEQKER